MKMNEREQLARAGGILVVAGVVGLNYLRIARSEKKKRAKIDLWQQTNLAVIHNSRDALLKMAEDPNISFGEFWRRFREEAEFIKIVNNQPPY